MVRDAPAIIIFDFWCLFECVGIHTTEIYDVMTSTS